MSSSPSTTGETASATKGTRVRRWLSTLLNIALLLASLAVAIGAAEVGVRVVKPQQLVSLRPDIWEARDSIGWAKRPRLRARINTGEREVDVFTDRDGNRVGRRGRMEATTQILLLGDSFMEALQVEYEQSLAGLLETTLAAHFNRPIAIRNTGVSAWDPPQYYLMARSLLSRESFDVVLVSIYLGNDIVSRRPAVIQRRQPTVVHHLRLPRRATWKELVDAVLYPVNDFLEVRSHLFVLVKGRIRTLRMRAGLTADTPPTHVLRSEVSSQRWRVTAEICRDIARLAEEHGSKAVFLLIPAPEQVDTSLLSDYRRGFQLGEVDADQPTRLLSSALRDEELEVVDALPQFRAAFATGVQLYGRIDPHLTPQGHQVLERVIEQRLVTALESAAKPSTGRRGRRGKS